MNLAEAVKTFEAQFTSVQETATWHDGQVELMTGGLKGEGEGSPCFCRDEETAVRLWAEAAQMLVARGDVLVWRTRPALLSITLYDRNPASSSQPVAIPCFRVYSRLHITGACQDSAPVKADPAAIARDVVALINSRVQSPTLAEVEAIVRKGR